MAPRSESRSGFVSVEDPQPDGSVERGGRVEERVLGGFAARTAAREAALGSPRGRGWSAMDTALKTIGGDVAMGLGATGEGIVWAVIGTSVDAGHPHFATHRNFDLPGSLTHYAVTRDEQGMRVEELDITRSAPQSYSTGIASLIAGESRVDGRTLQGVAPRAKLMVFEVIRPDGTGDERAVIKALEQIETLNHEGRRIRVHGVTVALSVPPDLVNYACGGTPICAVADRLVRSGVVVVAPSGNAGTRTNTGNRGLESVPSSITDPGNAELVLTVGSTHSRHPEIYGPSYYSGRGPTLDGRPKPDLLAPGEKVLVAAIGGTYERMDGTGNSSAVASGAVAALLSIRRDLIGRPQQVKELLLASARDLNRDPYYQGRGIIDLAAALSDLEPETAGRHAPSARQLPPRLSAAQIDEGPPTVETPGRLRLFCSYAHEDREYWEELSGHLAPLEAAGLLDVWSDGELTGGEQWDERILNELEKADIILLFVSSYFVQSEYINSKELKRAMERHDAGTARVIPIVVRPVNWKRTPFAKLQAFPPPDAKPVTKWGEGEDARHDAWAETVGGIDRIVDEILGA